MKGLLDTTLLISSFNKSHPIVYPISRKRTMKGYDVKILEIGTPLKLFGDTRFCQLTHIGSNRNLGKKFKRKNEKKIEGKNLRKIAIAEKQKLLK